MSTNVKGRFKGLRFKIFLVSALCMVIPMLITLLTSSYISEKYLTESTRNSLLNSSIEKKNQIELALSDIERHAQSIAMQPTLINTLDFAMTNSVDPSETELQEISKILEQNFELGDGLFENMYVMYKNRDIADGIGGVSVGWENEEVGSAKNLLIREAIASPTTGRPVITIITPIKSNGKHLGTLGTAIELNNVSEKIIDNNANDFKTLILNSSGLVISSTDPEHVLSLNFQDEESGLQELFSTIQSENMGIGYFSREGVDYVTAYTTSSKYGMYILTYKPVAESLIMVENLKVVLYSTFFFSILLTAVVIYFYASKITKPILTVAGHAELLANGDLSAEIPKELRARKDELGKLSNSFATMITDLKEIISKITVTSDQVAASSQELYASGEQVGKAAEDVGKTILEIASGAEEQSAQIGSALSNLSNLVSQINEVDTGTDNMKQTTEHMLDYIDRGSRSAAESVKRINDLKTDTEDVSKVIFSLGDTSNQIGQIIELISGIAEQTNMLALNATIEAARAGEAGRGFSVVAAEVRKLAEESADASRNIAKLVVDIRNGVDIAVNKMDDSVRSVNASVKAIEENGDIFSEINGQAERLKDIVAKVTQNVKAMTESSREFELVMQDINETSNEFAANSESVSAASEEQIALTDEIVTASKAMADMSEELSSLIRNFKF